MPANIWNPYTTLVGQRKAVIVIGSGVASYLGYFYYQNVIVQHKKNLEERQRILAGQF